MQIWRAQLRARLSQRLLVLLLSRSWSSARSYNLPGKVREGRQVGHDWS